jgi:hypothetical protein
MRLLALLITFGCATGMARGASAQDAARYGALVDSLARAWSRLRAAEHQRDSLATAGVRLDTTQVGPLMVLANPEHAPRAAQAAQIAWDRVRPVLGPDTLLAARRYYLRQAASMQPAILGAEVRRIVYDPRSEPAELANAVVNQLGQDLASDAHALLRVWAGAVIPLDRLNPLVLARAYRELVTSGVPATPDCVRGDVRACAALLRLHESRMPAGPDPTLPSARRALMQEAIEIGPDGAYGRLIAARGGTIAAVLEAAAGVPADSILRTWHMSVVASRPESTGLTRRGAWVAFLWIVLFGVIATRSSRWRFA